MSATNVARVDRVRQKKKMLEQQFLGRKNVGFPKTHFYKGLKPERHTALPPWWSLEVHGDAGKCIEPAKHTTKQDTIIGKAVQARPRIESAWFSKVAT